MTRCWTDQNACCTLWASRADVTALPQVDIHIMRNPSSGDWTYLGTEVTDGSGRATHTIASAHRLPQGMYPVKMVVRGDHTCVDFYLTVLPPRTDVIVFSIDGAFTASVSIMGKDPKVRPAAVDVVRCVLNARIQYGSSFFVFGVLFFGRAVARVHWNLV